MWLSDILTGSASAIDQLPGLELLIKKTLNCWCVDESRYYSHSHIQLPLTTVFSGKSEILKDKQKVKQKPSFLLSCKNGQIPFHLLSEGFWLPFVQIDLTHFDSFSQNPCSHIDNTINHTHIGNITPKTYLYLLTFYLIEYLWIFIQITHFSEYLFIHSQTESCINHVCTWFYRFFFTYFFQFLEVL